MSRGDGLLVFWMSRFYLEGVEDPTGVYEA